MKIDEKALTAAIDAAADCGWNFEKTLHRGDMAAIIRAYLAALPTTPEAKKGRDRIAVVVNAYGGGTADVMPGDPSLFDWGQLEDAAGEFEIEGPFAQNVVTCNLRYYEPAQPVEVEGSVEGVG